MTKILELDPSNAQARRTIIRLKPLADEKREKMKEEMIGMLIFLIVHVVIFYNIAPTQSLRSIASSVYMLRFHYRLNTA